MKQEIKKGRKPITDRSLVRLNRVEFLVNEIELEALKKRSKDLKKSLGKTIREALKLS